MDVKHWALGFFLRLNWTVLPGGVYAFSIKPTTVDGACRPPLCCQLVEQTFKFDHEDQTQVM